MLALSHMYHLGRKRPHDDSMEEIEQSCFSSTVIIVLTFFDSDWGSMRRQWSAQVAAWVWDRHERVPIARLISVLGV